MFTAIKTFDCRYHQIIFVHPSTEGIPDELTRIVYAKLQHKDDAHQIKIRLLVDRESWVEQIQELANARFQGCKLLEVWEPETTPEDEF
jgi:hypothetical protein